MRDLGLGEGDDDDDDIENWGLVADRLPGEGVESELLLESPLRNLAMVARRSTGDLEPCTSSNSLKLWLRLTLYCFRFGWGVKKSLGFDLMSSGKTG